MYSPSKIFSQEEIKQIKLFALSISENRIPLEYKDHYMTSSGKTWDIDTYTHGVAKYLSMEEDDFMQYFELVKFNDTTMCSNLPLFLKLCDWKIRSFELLKTVSDFADNVFIVEAGRGIDVLLASFVKPWKKITAYDQDKSVLVEMNRHFTGRMKLPFEPLQLNTFAYGWGSINEKTIIFGTCQNLDEDIKYKITHNPNLLMILDGELLK